LFEEELAKQNVPLEIKYLAVVESVLNPKAVSKMGATGLWQFMYQTGKQYNLKIDLISMSAVTQSYCCGCKIHVDICHIW
jgi:membrane-bound lytic murein transglycosylase MltF